jgi:hypothetical protein
MDHFREVDGLNGDSLAFQDLLTVANGVESSWPGTDDSHPEVLESPIDPTNPSKTLQVPLKSGGSRINGVEFGQRVFDSVLVEVVADRDLAAEGIPAVSDGQLILIIWIGLYQDRYIQPRPADGIGNCPLIAKVGKGDEHTVNFISVLDE